MSQLDYFMMFFGAAVGLFVIMWLVGSRPKRPDSEDE